MVDIDDIFRAASPTATASAQLGFRTKRSRPQRSRWSQGRGLRGTRASKARTGHRDGSACHKRWNAYGKPRKGRRRSSLRSSKLQRSDGSSDANDDLTGKLALHPRPEGSARCRRRGPSPGAVLLIQTRRGTISLAVRRCTTSFR